MHRKVWQKSPENPNKPKQNYHTKCGENCRKILSVYTRNVTLVILFF